MLRFRVARLTSVTRKPASTAKAIPRNNQGEKRKIRKKGRKRPKESVWTRLGRKLLGKKAEEVSDKYVVANPLYYYDEEGTWMRPLPTGLDKQEEKILKKIRENAYRLDYKCFGCCGCSCCSFTFGRTTIIGVVPAAGPIIDVALGICMVNLKARKLDLPWSVSAMMYVRHAVSEGVGLVPVFGDFWIAWYKVNSRNSFAVEKVLEKRGRERIQMEKNADPDPALLPSK